MNIQLKCLAFKVICSGVWKANSEQDFDLHLGFRPFYDKNLACFYYEVFKTDEIVVKIDSVPNLAAH